MIGKRSALTLLVSLLVVVALIGTGVALAQNYPPPVGSLTVASATTTPAAGTSTVLTATVRDDQGSPIEGADVTFTIVGQPGNDANLEGALSKTVKSGANGVASVTLFTGTKPGPIVLGIQAGEKTSQLTLEVGGAPPAAPKTGGPPPEDDGGIPGWLIAVFVGSGLLAAGGAITMLGRRRGRA